MNRRDFIKLSLGSMMFKMQRTGIGQNLRAPDILVIVTGQHNAQALSFLGNPHVSTPHIDQLARTGVVFLHAYCAQPLCTPSWMAMFTGKMPHETGITINKSGHRGSSVMAANLLSRAGYDTAYLGNWYFPISHHEKSIHGFAQLKYTCGNRSDNHLASAFLEVLKTKRKNPFFLVASFVNPHDISWWVKGNHGSQGSYIKPPPANECPPLPDNFLPPLDEPTVLRLIQTFAPKLFSSAEWTPKQWRQYLWGYYRLIETVDKQIGQLLHVLQENGDPENTLIFFTSDHGEGAAGHRWNHAQALYEQVIRVPLIISHPGMDAHINETHLVSTGLDLLPTWCDLASIECADGYLGNSLKPLLNHSAERLNWREFIVSETEFCSDLKSHGIYGRMLRTARYKYIIYSTGANREQLFDLVNDPGESQSLVRHKEFATDLWHHRRLLRQWCRETDDPFYRFLGTS
ncbi:sulfatase-like hydrolase/transferase [candidate division KSB1 bacterium]|nr:sulfatase-like hydrolase/transferase [candidate division KSB1 bacterium]